MTPVNGQVVWEDGSPAGNLDGYTVEAEIPGGKTMTRGPVGKDGRFTLSTANPDDGVEPGEYRAILAPIARAEFEPPHPVQLPARYRQYETSGLAFTVVRGKPNEVTLSVSRK